MKVAPLLPKMRRKGTMRTAQATVVVCWIRDWCLSGWMGSSGEPRANLLYLFYSLQRAVVSIVDQANAKITSSRSNLVVGET